MFVGIRTEASASGIIGKLVSRLTETALVEFFDAPTSQLRTEEITAAALEPITLPEQTRLFHFNEAVQAWEIGRLLDDHGTSQLVRFPNGQTRHLPVSDVFVRSGAPIEDPTPFLAAKITETPRFADGRSAFVRSRVTQRGAAMGMSALLSSAIELEAHQIEVVRRILQDPIQRYLLADEVGLGKTIEAGLLIRQFLLDAGSAGRVLVIAPEPLVPQWRSELKTKFFLGGYLDSALQVVALSDQEQILRHLRLAHMLVIDEAHHLTRQRARDARKIYTALAAAAPSIDRILLLSATPALHNERGFLEMLHLLDPGTYRLEDESGFRHRIENRQALAAIVANLTPDNVLYLDYSLDKLAELFPGDNLLQSEVAALRTICDRIPSEDDPDLIEALGRVRSHLSEVYRLHRRVLRHRRRNIGGLTPDRAGVSRIEYEAPEAAEFVASFDDWRLEDLNGQDSDERDEGENAGAHVFSEVLERVFEHRHPDGLGHLPELGARGGPRLQRLLARLADPELYLARVRSLAQALGSMLAPRRQFLVFCSDPMTADALARDLADLMSICVDRQSANSEAWRQFNLDPARPILVCDRQAEEGLNLQGGRKLVVHWDLPLDPNRVEQRLGRADRYGSGDSVSSVVLSCRDDPLEAAWIEFLDQGLKIFNRSVASLQYLIEDTTRSLREKVMAENVEALQDLTVACAGDEGLIEREIRNIDQQDALDALGAPPTEHLDALTDVDEAWQGLEADGDGWIVQNLQFRRIRERRDPAAPDNSAPPFRFQYSTEGDRTLVPLQTFYERCHMVVDHTPVNHKGTVLRTLPVSYRRRTALSRYGRSLGLRLLRYGDPFIEGMFDITQTDDRGRSTAVWRYYPDHRAQAVADLFFRFDFIVEADVEAALQVLARENGLTSASSAAMHRRGDMALAPFFHTLWLDEELTEVANPALLRRLSAVYRPEPDDDGGRDFNLNPRRWRNLRRLELPHLAQWAELCHAARERAEAQVRQLPSFTAALEAAARKSAEVERGRLAQLRARAERSGTGLDEAECAIEQALSEALLAGIRDPKIRLDAIWAAFVCGDARSAAIVDARQ